MRLSNLLDEWNDVEYVLLVRNVERWSVVQRASTISLIQAARSLLKMVTADLLEPDDEDEDDEDDEC